MKTIIKISFFSLFLFGCQHEKSTSRFDKLLLEGNTGKTYDKVYTKSSAQIIKDLEKKHRKNICDTTYTIILNTPTGINRNSNLLFSMFQYCYPHIPDISLTDIQIIDSTNITIDYKNSNIDSIEYNLASFLNYRFDKKENILIQIRLAWNPVKKEIFETVLTKVYMTIENFANEKSIELYGKNIDSLSETEFEFFKSCFYISNNISRINTIPKNKYSAQQWL